MRTFVHRHPAISLLALGFVQGFALAALLEALGVENPILTIAVAATGLITGWNWEKLRAAITGGER